jgi:hypothetical protein
MMHQRRFAAPHDPGALAWQARAARQLWLSVLVQACRDIFRTAASKYGCDLAEHRAAIAWIGSRDFHRVCALAGMDGAATAARLKRRLAEQDAGTFDPTPHFYKRGGAGMHRVAGGPRA